MRLIPLSIVALALACAGCSDRESEPAQVAETSQGAPATISAEQTPVAGPPVDVLAFGDSLFAGYGLEEGESYPAQLKSALRARGINAEVTNAGVSGDTTAAGRQRLAFVLDAQEQAPDLFILELGGNDLLRGLPPEQTRENLDAMLTELGERDIPVLLMGMRAPPNAGPEFQSAFDAIYPDLARKHGAALVPFFLDSVYDKPTLFQRDRIHPTAEGTEAIVAATVDEVAEALPEPE